MGGKREEGEREEVKGKEGGGRRGRKPLDAKCVTFKIRIMTLQRKMVSIQNCGALQNPYSMTTLTFDQEASLSTGSHLTGCS